MKFPSCFALLSASILANVHAGTPSSLPIEEVVTKSSNDKSLYDKIWGLAKLYKNDENPVLQEFALQGRLHLQWADGDSNQGSYGSEDRPEENLWGDIEARRFRLGFKSKWFNQFKLDGQINVSPNFDPEFYGNIYDLNLTWTPSERFNIGVGKYKANFFSQEQATSSNNILTFERSLLSNTLFAGELTGVKINGAINNWVYTVGVYAGDEQREFTEFEAGTIIQAGVGYDFSKLTGLEKALVKLDYQYSDDALNAGGGAGFDHAVSLNSTWEQGRFSITTDLLAGEGRGSQGDVWGFHFIPAYFLADGLQFVMRYQYAQGEEDALRVQSRYERLAPNLTNGGRGEEFQALYFGLNYYLYGHKLKLMAGTEYTDMKGGVKGGDFSGWTGLVGLRLHF